MLKFNDPVTKDKEYTETGQINLMRWKTLFREEDGTFTPTSLIFKCKDYLNDMVLARKGHFFMMYGFYNEKKGINTEGLYVHVLHLKKDFMHNLGLVNDWCERTNKLGETFCVSVVESTKDEAILLIPAWVMESTYLVSLVSWLIRISSHDKATSCENLMKGAYDYGDCPFKAYYQGMLDKGMNLPTKDKHVYYNYSGDSENRPFKVKSHFSFLHHNGIADWLSGLSMRTEDALV